MEVLRLAVVGERVDVEVELAVQRDAGQDGVVERPLGQVREARLAGDQQHPPAPHDAGDGGAGLAVRQLVRQLVRLAERLGQVPRADPAGEVQLAADHVVQLALERVEQRLLAGLQVDVGDPGRQVERPDGVALDL